MACSSYDFLWYDWEVGDTFLLMLTNFNMVLWLILTQMLFYNTRRVDFIYSISDKIWKSEMPIRVGSNFVASILHRWPMLLHMQTFVLLFKILFIANVHSIHRNRRPMAGVQDDTQVMCSSQTYASAPWNSREVASWLALVQVAVHVTSLARV